MNASQASLLDNVVWHTLAGPHRHYTVGNQSVRRYLPGFPPIAGFRDPRHPDWPALEQLVAPGEHVYCDGLAGTIPHAWRIESESTLAKMTWDGSVAMDDPAPEAIRLDASCAPAAVELAALTIPGPFTSRTLELGDYFGVYDGTRLIAMAGSRTCAGRWSEISGVCTHPDYAGRGLARRLVTKLLQRQLRRNDIPFLRVMQDNAAARQLYLRLGFRDYALSLARTIVRCRPG